MICWLSSALHLMATTMARNLALLQQSYLGAGAAPQAMPHGTHLGMQRGTRNCCTACSCGFSATPSTELGSTAVPIPQPHTHLCMDGRSPAPGSPAG